MSLTGSRHSVSLEHTQFNLLNSNQLRAYQSKEIVFDSYSRQIKRSLNQHSTLIYATLIHLYIKS